MKKKKKKKGGRRARKRLIVEIADDVTEVILVHPGGHIDAIQVDRGRGRLS